MNTIQNSISQDTSVDTIPDLDLLYVEGKRNPSVEGSLPAQTGQAPEYEASPLQRLSDRYYYSTMTIGVSWGPRAS